MADTWDSNDFTRLVKETEEALPVPGGHLQLSAPGRRKLRVMIKDHISKLVALCEDLDHIKKPDRVLDPSDPALMGELIAMKLIQEPKLSLGTLPRFYGSGVYAIYYTGTFPAYKKISGLDLPIYVGKVDPRSKTAKTPEEQGDKLWKRLVQDHARNIIKASSTLNIDDFDCRFLVVQSAWQTTAETFLINSYRPIWNSEIKICFGFGKHGDSAETRSNTRSPWDELHPGRKWAMDSTPYPGGAEAIMKAIDKHYSQTSLTDE